MGGGLTVVAGSFSDSLPQVSTHIFSLIADSVMSSSVVGALVKGRKEMFYLTTHSTHFIYGYMALDIW